MKAHESSDAVKCIELDPAQHQGHARHGDSALPSPEMARKPLWVNLLAYNLIRLLMAQAALLADQMPRQLSFKHTSQV